MVDAFRQYLDAHGTFTDAERERIDELTVTKYLKRGEFLLREGEVCRFRSFVFAGTLRLYRTDESGVEHILRFAVENWWLSDLESYSSGLPSKSAIDALEDSRVLLWSRENWTRLTDEIPALAEMVQRLLARNLDAHIDRVYSAISDPAEARYHAFVESFPDFYQRVPLYMVASYLGVSRETLSRIRKQTSKR